MSCVLEYLKSNVILIVVLLIYIEFASSLSSIMNPSHAAPFAAPTSVRVSGAASSNIIVQWGAVDCIHRNGDITGYSVRYGEVESGSTQTVSVSGGSVTISNLTLSTNYTIQVAAVNSAGIGVYSDPPITAETVPISIYLCRFMHNLCYVQCIYIYLVYRFISQFEYYHHP